MTRLLLVMVSAVAFAGAIASNGRGLATQVAQEPTRPQTVDVVAERFSFTISIFLLAMVVLGGMGNVWGVILGAFILSWVNGNGLTALGETVNGRLGTNIDFASFTFLLFGMVLILMMLFRREGLIPESRLKLVLHEGDEEDSKKGAR